MQKALLMVFLAMVSHGAADDWVLVALSNDGAIAAYADASTIAKTGYHVKIRNLFNYKRVHVADGKTYLSYMSEDEYDCSIGTTRTLSSTFYAKNMGEGEMVTLDNTADAKFQPFATDSLDSSLWEFACAKH